MLFLGTLDDKTIEYPYGESSNSPLDTRRLILHHLLFSKEPLVLEEGFILASEEALNPHGAPLFLLLAIKSGQVKVASRYGDMHSYVEERRQNKHASPSDDEYGNKYIKVLQSVCDEAGAFIKYPSENIDEITFKRFTQLCEKDKTHEIFNFAQSDLTQEFVDEYTYAYEKGNNGKSWTARSAWESVAKSKFGSNPELIHALMCMANRERQIVRAAGIADANGIDMKVETGFEIDPHELATTETTISFDKINTDLIYPKVGIDDLLKNSEQFFKHIENPYSSIRLYREVYVTQLNNISAGGDIGSLQRAASDYEREIYKAIGVEPHENSLPLNVAGTIVTGAVLGGAITALLSHLRKKRDKPMFNDMQARKYTRREALRIFSCTGLITALHVADNVAGNAVTKTIQHVRVTSEEDTGDDFESQLELNNLSHQILTIKPDIVT